MTDEQCKNLGCQLGSVMVTLSAGTGFVSYPFSTDGGFLSQSYVQEKLVYRIGDVAPVTRMLGYLLNRPTA
jgi:hypothetical protein